MIIVVGLVNYLSDPQLFKFFVNCKNTLQPHGMLVITAWGPSTDAAFFSDFLGWSMIRRTSRQIVALAEFAGLEVKFRKEDSDGTPAMVLSFTPT